METQFAVAPTNGQFHGCTSKKKCFNSREEAETFERENRERYNNPKQHSYACDHCPNWHLTSMAPTEHVGNAIHRTTSNTFVSGNNRPLSPREARLKQINDLRRSGTENNDICDILGISYKELLETTNWAKLNDVPVEPAKNTRGRKPGETAEAIVARRKDMTALVASGKTYSDIRTLLKPQGWPESTIWAYFNEANHDRRTSLGITSAQPKPVTLDAVSEQRRQLEAQLASLTVKENALREAQRIKAVFCWDGKGVLISKESNRVGIPLEDVPELIQILTDLVTQPEGD